jgi:2-aminoadipate transaminase
MTDYSDFFSGAARVMQESAIRKMGGVVAQGRDIISFAPGYPDPAVFLWDHFRALASDLLSGSDGSVLQYGPTRGYKPLIGVLAELLAERGVAATAEQLIITTGSQQGLDLVARVLLDPGDVVLVELPSYIGALSAFKNVQATAVGVRQEADGIDLSDLESVVRRLRADGRRVRVLYVVPNFQNPTGLLIGRDKRSRLLEIAARHDLLIVEDDPYRDIYFEDSTGVDDIRPIKAEDDEGRVVYLSSFSKTLAPGFRVAWIAAPAPLVAKFELAKQSEDLCTGGFDQRMVYEACHRGLLAQQIPLLRRHYRAKRDVMAGALARELTGIVRWPGPRGGFFLWATLPDRIDADVMLDRAVEQGVVYVAGSSFFVDGSGRNTLRLSFSAPTPERIEEGVRRLAVTIREALEQPRAEAASPARR